MKEKPLEIPPFQSKYLQLKKTYNPHLFPACIPKITNFDFKSINLKKSPIKPPQMCMKQSMLPANIS
jgi:hypothetical protein